MYDCLCHEHGPGVAASRPVTATESGWQIAVSRDEASIINTDSQKLIETARSLVANDKGLLAMDECNPTCDKRFAKLATPQTAEARRAFTVR
jgi:hypothetical protein